MENGGVQLYGMLLVAYNRCMRVQCVLGSKYLSM